ncbi:MAG: patatin-like phospholipase family protein [Fibrobacter sp.]|nr:patatin-like phospholipase family protein [Fibrobacter sp.]
MKLVISVSGGGALGIGPLQFMRRLEADLGKKLGDVCAAFAGTSTGSIIASGLCSGMSADELYGMYNDNLSAIFTKRKGTVVPELASNYYRYDNANLKKLLYKYFPGKMDAFDKPIFIPTTFMNGESVEKVWNREDSWMDRAFAVLSSCSAPTYFDTLNLDGKIFCDGGLWANDPIMVLESGIKNPCKPDKKACKEIMDDGFIILAFNTGMVHPNNAPKKKNALGWLNYIMDEWVARTGNSNYFEACANIGKDNIFRCAPEVASAYEMDNLKKVKEVSDIWDKYYGQVKQKVLKFVKTAL